MAQCLCALLAITRSQVRPPPPRSFQP
ncbi:uncharacterized protein CELE_ZK380.6 [Caenorhabditis elegans]|uniref:Uncharacterized protein n=1 Tax=Caenorhabditis elegans TaxID=6239 RepID=A0A5E4M2R3_CAEEL|nr:Uncharacterized protein CELE_ZK380.6 [Caenorhabditis elegans]VVC12413.1 Uncharacterized protein CELE_ZK380.6 [Caenorhabditis elegans]